MNARVSELKGIALDDAVRLAFALVDGDDELLEIALVNRLKAALAKDD